MNMIQDTIPNKRCQMLFEEFNQRYFDGRLSSYRVLVVERIPDGYGGLSGFCYKSHHLILIRRQTSEATLAGILLHEMAHAVTPSGHGGEWLAEMQRLKQAGAPILEDEFKDDFYERLAAAQAQHEGHAIDPELVLSRIPDSKLISSLRVTREFIRQLAQEAYEGGDLTLHQFTSWLVSEYCLSDSQEALLRWYPWIPRVFSDVKKKVRKERAAMEALRKELEQRGLIPKAAETPS